MKSCIPLFPTNPTPYHTGIIFPYPLLRTNQLMHWLSINVPIRVIFTNQNLSSRIWTASERKSLPTQHEPSALTAATGESRVEALRKETIELVAALQGLSQAC